MRLFLDAHISGRRAAQALRNAGYDVRAADEERELDGLDDADLLLLAADERRVLVTFNLKDFLPILREWAEAGRCTTGAYSSRAACATSSSAGSLQGSFAR